MSISLEKINKVNGLLFDMGDIDKIDNNSTKIEDKLNSLPSSFGSTVTTSATNGNIKIDGLETSVYIHPSGTNPHGTTKNDVGLGNVTNESKTTMFTSPIFTGVPISTTASAGTNTTQIATTEFVTTAVNNNTSISGNASTATKLATPRTISLSGDITGTATSFDGSTNITITTTEATTGVTAGTYPKVTVDAKGRVTSGTTLTATDIPSLTVSKISNMPTIPIIVALTSAEYSAIGTPDVNTLYLIKV